MSEIIKDFEEVGPREIYDRGYDDGLKRGLDVAKQTKLQYQAIERHRDALIKAIADHNMLLPPHPIVVKKEDLEFCDLSQ